MLQLLRKNCSFCGEIAEELSSIIEDNTKFTILKCGHEISSRLIESIEEKEEEEKKELTSLNGKTLYPFQKEDLEKARQANFRCLFNWDVGLGKTPGVISCLRSYPSELLPALIITKSNLRIQTFRELEEWYPELTGRVQVLGNGGEFPLTEFYPICISSYDLLARAEWPDWKTTFKTIILDECQYIKNPGSARCRNVRKLGKQIPHILALSADPIKNHAGEFFPILNLLDELFAPSIQGFFRQWVGTYTVRISEYKNRTRLGGIVHWKLDEWKKRTSPFIFRRDRKEVGLQLPPIQKIHKFIELPEEVGEIYKRELARFLEADDRGDFEGKNSTVDILGYLAKLSHITGIAKVDNVVEFVSDFLSATEESKDKIVIFAHHKDVALLIQSKLSQAIIDEELEGTNPPLLLSAEDNKEKQDRTESEFKTNPSSRVMIAGLKSSSEGKNWQFCGNVVIAERSWTSVDEDQVAGRFSRINASIENVQVTIFNALGTPDEYKHEIVERKSHLIKESKTGEASNFDQSGTIQELLQLIRTKGRKRWSL